MKYDREPVYGRLHLIENTGNLPNGQPVAASINQGQPIAWAQGVTQRERENYFIDYLCNQEQYLSNQEAQEVLKDFIIKVFNKVYLQQLKQLRLGYKNVTLLQFMQLLRDYFQAEPEGRDEIKRALQENWNTAKHIEHLFDQIKELLEILADMQGNNNYTDDKFIKAMYMSVKCTREFDKDCEKWKKLPVAQHNTKDLCQTYFRDQYK